MSAKKYKTIHYFFLSLRPYQWSKNLIVFAALIFSGKLFHEVSLIKTFISFFLISFVAGWVYVVNDIKDVEADRLHPIKKNRPIASANISSKTAALLSSLLFIVSLVASYFISEKLTIILICYALLNLLYSYRLKHVVMLDILIISIGFVLRAAAGAKAIQVMISPWLLACTFFLSLFLVIGKRRNELVELGEKAKKHRQILGEYNEKILDQMIAVVTGITIVGYALYTLEEQTVQRFGTTDLIYTIPFVVYGVFRYYYLIYKRNLGGAPEKLIFQDKHLLLDIIAWIIISILIIYIK